MKHAQEIVEVIFPPHRESAIVLKPGEQPLDFPSAAVTTERPPILSTNFPVASVWSNHLHSGFGYVSVQAIRIVGVVTDQTFYRLDYEDFRESLLNECDFVRRGRFGANSHR